MTLRIGRLISKKKNKYVALPVKAKQSKVKVDPFPNKHYKHLSKYIVRKKIMVDETRMKEIEHQDLHGNRNREKTTG